MTAIINKKFQRFNLNEETNSTSIQQMSSFRQYFIYATWFWESNKPKSSRLTTFIILHNNGIHDFTEFTKILLQFFWKNNRP